MTRRQSTPRRWLVVDTRTGEDPFKSVRNLPRGSGLLVILADSSMGARARLLSKLRIIQRERGLWIFDELQRKAARVHNLREMRRAGLAGVPVIFLSPICATRSHPDWKPMPRMRAAALARLSKVPVIALGGMTERRFRHIARLGFQGWAGIDAWIRT